ncbi:MAG: site-2 protease family protein, partial [Hyphomicrobiales bacterium]
IVSVSAEIPLTIKVLRNGSEIDLNATPNLKEIDDRLGGIQRIGLLGIQRSSSPEAVIHKTFGPIGALNEGVAETGYVIKRTATFFVGLFTGRESVDQLGGPIRIAEVSKHVAAISFTALISLTAVLSVSIGIMNLLPIPVLDGGHLVFYAIEAVKGSPLSEKAQEYCFKFGLAVVLSMMVFVTTIDISRFF